MRNLDYLLVEVTGKELECITKEDKDLVMTLIGNIKDERARIVLRDRYLLQRCKTLDEIGTQLGVSGNRVRQIEQKYIWEMKKAYRGTVNSLDLYNLQLGNRLTNCLLRAGVNNIPELIYVIKSGKIHKIRGIGEVGAEAIISKCKSERYL